MCLCVLVCDFDQKDRPKIHLQKKIQDISLKSRNIIDTEKLQCMCFDAHMNLIKEFLFTSNLQQNFYFFSIFY